LGDRYEIHSTIGRGGMGEVFLAHDRRLDNDVAIKRLTPQFASCEELRTSLRREAQIMARLSDASIVRLFDLAEFFGDLYLILEYVPGPTLRDMIRNGYRASPQELAKAVSEICQALTVAHNAGVIHRDLKPSNMLLSLTGPERVAFLESHQLPVTLANARIKITDFGIAKAVADSHLTLTNAFSGTPGYMAPEQFQGEIPSPETDVYALGVVTYELLTGKLPEQPIADIPTVHPAVTQVIRRALSPARQSRFSSAAIYYQALYQAIEGKSPLQAPVPATLASVPSKVWIMLICSFIFVVAVLRVVSLLTNNESRSTSEAPVSAPKLPSVQWNPFPKISELPPEVEEARGKPAGGQGPEHPKVMWEASLPDYRLELAAIGVDGTVYLTKEGQICAIRDGKLQWAYQNTEFSAHIDEFDVGADGRAWFRISVMGEGQYYCLNRDGKGGRLARSLESQMPKHVDPHPYSCWKGRHTLSGPAGDMDLEDDCRSVAAGREGPVWVTTDGPQILAVNRQRGKIEQTYKPPCEPAVLLPTPANRLVFTCGDGSLHETTGAVEEWSRPGEGKMGFATAAANGTIYFTEARKGAPGGYIGAIDTAGKLLWTVNLPQVPEGSIAIGRGRLYVIQLVHDWTAENRVICLSD
jgi:serine/threonine protein kinase/outer membrane protein assembly factor BamB